MTEQSLPVVRPRTRSWQSPSSNSGSAPTDTVLEIGCGTGKVSVAMAKLAKKVYALDRRPEAISVATETARQAGVSTIEFSCMDAVDFLKNDQVFDCAFLGGTKNLAAILPAAGKEGEADDRHQRGDGEHA